LYSAPLKKLARHYKVIGLNMLLVSHNKQIFLALVFRDIFLKKLF
jgi:hypothetical protein